MNKLEKVQKFIDEIITLYKKYDLSISHEDCHGSFIIESYCEYNEGWLRDTRIGIEEDDELDKDFEELFN